MYKIITDGACDLSNEFMKMLNVDVVPFYVSVDNIHFQNDLNEHVIQEFYEYLVDNPNVFPKTSPPSLKDYLDAFSPYVEDETDVLCFCVTTKFSDSYHNAVQAKKQLLEKYPNAIIEIIDTTLNSVAQGMLVEEAVQMQNNGFTLQETAAYLNEIKKTGRIFFTIDGMEYLAHGGNAGKLASIAVTIGIKPLIELKEGEIFSNGLTRGRKKAKNKLIDHIITYFKDYKLNIEEYRFVIGFGFNKKEAEEFKIQFLTCMKQIFPTFHEEVSIRQIGVVSGVHTGPHPLGIGLIRKEK